MSSCSLTTSVERWSSTLVPLALSAAAASASLARTCALTHALTSKSRSPKALKVSSIPSSPPAWVPKAQQLTETRTKTAERGVYVTASVPQPSLDGVHRVLTGCIFSGAFRQSRGLSGRDTYHREQHTSDELAVAAADRIARSKSKCDPTCAMTKKKVAIVGSGNWGCAIAKIVGANAARHNHLNEEVIPSHPPTPPPPARRRCDAVLACLLAARAARPARDCLR